MKELDNLSQLGKRSELPFLLGVTSMTLYNWSKEKRKPKSKMWVKYIRLISHIIEKEGVETVKKLLEEK